MNKKYANVLLKDGKIMFWWSGDKCNSEYDFYKDFFYSNLNMAEELKSGKYSIVTQEIPFIGSEEEQNFYKQFEIHPQSKGKKPYEQPYCFVKF